MGFIDYDEAADTYQGRVYRPHEFANTITPKKQTRSDLIYGRKHNGWLQRITKKSPFSW